MNKQQGIRMNCQLLSVYTLLVQFLAIQQDILKYTRTHKTEGFFDIGNE